MSKLTIFREMERELTARKAALTKERAELERAAERIAAIDSDIAVIDGELAEYSAAPEIVADNKRLFEEQQAISKARNKGL